MPQRFYIIHRTPDAERIMKNAQTALYGDVQPRAVTSTILRALDFMAKYNSYVQNTHPDFQPGKHDRTELIAMFQRLRGSNIMLPWMQATYDWVNLEVFAQAVHNLALIAHPQTRYNAGFDYLIEWEQARQDTIAKGIK